MPNFECPHCCASLNAPAEHEGHTVKCAKCGESFLLRFPEHSKTVIMMRVSDHRLSSNDEATTVQFAPEKPSDKPFPEPPAGGTPG
jgi:transcription elongation factor Elf1